MQLSTMKPTVKSTHTSCFRELHSWLHTLPDITSAGFLFGQVMRLFCTAHEEPGWLPQSPRSFCFSRAAGRGPPSLIACGRCKWHRRVQRVHLMFTLRKTLGTWHTDTHIFVPVPLSVPTPKAGRGPHTAAFRSRPSNPEAGFFFRRELLASSASRTPGRDRSRVGSRRGTTSGISLFWGWFWGGGSGGGSWVVRGVVPPPGTTPRNHPKPSSIS